MKPSRNSRTRWRFRLAAVGLGLLPFLLLEITLHVIGAGEASEVITPAISFTGVRPLFELSEDGERYETAKSRKPYFQPDSFAVKKPKNGFRIFCLGGSTVQGRPYSIETSFTSWLELNLRAADDRREWEVINCGGVSYASYRLLPILEEVLQHDPDLLVFYTGHNEFLEATTFSEAKRQRTATQAKAWLSHVRMLNLLHSARSEHRQPVLLPEEVDALLDYQDGLADYRRDDAWRASTIASFDANLRQMVRLANNVNVSVVLLNPVSNLKDCPPFKVERDGALSANEGREFDALWRQARAEDDVDRRVELLEAALAIDGRHAAARFLLGHAHLARHQPREAREQFLLAKDEDVCPLRMIEPLHEALREVASDTKTPLLDIRQTFDERSDSGIPGDQWLVDHVHPSINGHQMIADELTEYLIESGVVTPRPSWQKERERLYAEHLGTLDTVYYANGQARLRGLIRWTQGRAIKLRENDKPTSRGEEE